MLSYDLQPWSHSAHLDNFLDVSGLLVPHLVLDRSPTTSHKEMINPFYIGVSDPYMEECKIPKPFPSKEVLATNNGPSRWMTLIYNYLTKGGLSENTKEARHMVSHAVYSTRSMQCIVHEPRRNSLLVGSLGPFTKILSCWRSLICIARNPWRHSTGPPWSRRFNQEGVSLRLLLTNSPPRCI